MLTPPNELSFLCLARKRESKQGEVFTDFHGHPIVLRACGEPPYYLVRVTLASEGAYWGWWTPEEQWGWWTPEEQRQPIIFIGTVRQHVSICFPYGPEVEENRNRGRVVRCNVEEIRTLTPEECKFSGGVQISELTTKR